MERTVGVAQLMDGFFEEPLLQKCGIVGQTVKFVIQAMS